jgi:hypothetical protein
LLCMVPSLGHHHARRALSRQSLEGEFCEVGLPISFSEVRHNLGAGVVGCSVTNELGGDHGLLERRTAPAAQGLYRITFAGLDAADGY